MRRQLKQAGQSTEGIPEKPEIDESLEFYYDAFIDLCTTRINGMGMSPISVIAIDAYADRRGYTQFQFYVLHKVVRAMDTVMLEKHADDTKKQQNKGTKGSK